MAVIGLCFVLLLICNRQIECEAGLTTQVSDVILDVQSIYSCNDAYPLTDFSAKLETGDDGDKALSCSVDIGEEITDEFTVNLKIGRDAGGVWQNVFDENGKLCEYLDKFAEKAWEKTRNKIVPSIPEKCKVDPGHYDLQDLKLSPKDFKVSASLGVGTFKVELRAFNSNEDLFLCYTAEIEVRNF